MFTNFDGGYIMQSLNKSTSGIRNCDSSKTASSEKFLPAIKRILQANPQVLSSK